ncbi:MAG: type II toxin-antitoxin system HicA family toxin [Bacillota bacterium]|uniref:type II toxin-antitoxin system HicA family toxin n=1 Tax=Desulfitobacterium hafniense TaxID=49338 RepID=UPI0002F4DA3C|nr:type II toxin-antitoxin system HicA family toxin [Desulfitobacterium hafniense]MEA5024617.1 type II toxin-antitoxin system HicA family toxin [Desulfitobacterium hafniense]
MGKQITVRKVLEKLKEEGFIKSPNHGKGTSHQRYIHKNDPTKYADISYHHSGQVIPKGTLNGIERSPGVKF